MTTTQENQVPPSGKNPDDPNAQQPPAVNYSEKYPNYKYYKFPDGSVYYGETAIVNKDNKIITDPSTITDEEEKSKLRTVRHGFGIMLYDLKENGKYSAKYEGRFYLDKRKGKGKSVYSNGTIFEGEFDNDLYEGQGKIASTSGYNYKGNWSAGRLDGEGRFKHPDGHVLKGTFKNSYYYCKESDCFIYPFLSLNDVESFKLKYADFASKTKGQFEKFSRENLIRITNQEELMNAIDETYRANKVPLILRSQELEAKKEDILSMFDNKFREIDCRYYYSKLHETSLVLNTEIFNDVKQNVTEAMTKGLFLILNFDDCKEPYDFTYDVDLREFYGNMMLSPFMWNPSLFFQPKCSNAHLCNRSDLKMDRNFKLVCYSKFLVDEKVQEHDLINDIEKRFEKCFPLVNMNVIIATKPQPGQGQKN